MTLVTTLLSIYPSSSSATFTSFFFLSLRFDFLFLDFREYHRLQFSRCGSSKSGLRRETLLASFRWSGDIMRLPPLVPASAPVDAHNTLSPAASTLPRRNPQAAGGRLILLSSSRGGGKDEQPPVIEEVVETLEIDKAGAAVELRAPQLKGNL